jgi:hypothetical protein
VFRFLVTALLSVFFFNLVLVLFQMERLLHVFLCDSAEDGCLDVAALFVPQTALAVVCLSGDLDVEGNVTGGLVLEVEGSHRAFTRREFVPSIRPAWIIVLSSKAKCRVAGCVLADSRTRTFSKLSYLCRVPACLSVRDAAKGDVEKFVQQLFLRSSSDVTLVLQDVNLISQDNGVLVKCSRENQTQCVEQLMKHQNSDVCVRRVVGNVLYEGILATFCIIVSHVFPSRYQCDGGFVRLDDGRCLSWKTFGLDVVTEMEMKKSAADALEGINLGLPVEDQLRLACVDVVLELCENGRCEPWVVRVNARPSGFSNAMWFKSPSLIWSEPNLDLVNVICSDSDEWHIPLLRDSQNQADSLAAYLASNSLAGDPLLLLKQGRACLVLGDLLFRFRDLKVDFNVVSQVQTTRDRLVAAVADKDMEYLAFQNAFLLAANEREMLDFEASLESLHRPCYLSLQRSCSSRSGMRIGLSSGNASDNWTHTKLRGSAVLNCAIDLSTESVVQVTVELLQDSQVLKKGIQKKKNVFKICQKGCYFGVRRCNDTCRSQKSSVSRWARGTSGV